MICCCRPLGETKRILDQLQPRCKPSSDRHNHRLYKGQIRIVPQKHCNGLILHFWPDHSSDHENKSSKDHQNRLCKICPDYGGKAWSKIFARVLHKKLHSWTLIGGLVLTSSNCEDASNCKKNQDCQVQSTFTWYIIHVIVVPKNGLKLCFTFETKSQLDIKCSRKKIRLRLYDKFLTF